MGGPRPLALPLSRAMKCSLVFSCPSNFLYYEMTAGAKESAVAGMHHTEGRAELAAVRATWNPDKRMKAWPHAMERGRMGKCEYLWASGKFQYLKLRASG